MGDNETSATVHPAEQPQTPEPITTQAKTDPSGKDELHVVAFSPKADIAATQVKQSPPETPKEGTLFLTLVGMAFYGGIGLVVAWNTKSGQAFIRAHSWWILAGLALVAALSVIPATQRWLDKATPQRRTGFVIFVLVPAVFLGVGTIILLPLNYQVAALRGTFLLVACTLPALMYYLFIATKKYSLLNEFVMNLDRLALRSALAGESEEQRQSRVRTYLQKFEAVYGAVPTDMTEPLVEPKTQLKPGTTGASTFGSIFTFDTAVPVLLATMLIAVGWLSCLPPWEGQFSFTQQHMSAAQPGTTPSVEDMNKVQKEWTARWIAAFSPLRGPVQYAFLGAYFFSLQLLFRRYVRRDLRASAYVAVSLRIVLSVIGTWAIFAALPTATGGAIESDKLLVIGFVIGVFPKVAWQVIQSAAKKVTGLVVESLQTELPISELDGLTVWHETRLEEEDIENVPNMATAELVDVLINTRIPPERLIDWVDQAILYTTLGPEDQKSNQATRRTILRMHGIRTASSLLYVYKQSHTTKDTEAFEKLFQDTGRSSIRSLAAALDTCPNLKLVQTWRGLSDSNASSMSAQSPPVLAAGT